MVAAPVRSDCASHTFATTAMRSRNFAPCILLLLSAALALPASAQTVDPGLWGTDGTVSAILRSGNTIYIAGGFTAVGRPCGGGVPVGARDARPESGFPEVAGEVRVVIPDGSGGWFIGGQFVAVGGVPRQNLAHILPDLSVDSWSPVLDGWAASLALHGRTLYVGGRFLTINHTHRRNVGAIDVITGAVEPWNPGANEQVWALASRGKIVYAGGYFDSIAGQPRGYVAALDARSGTATDWNPNANYAVLALEARGNLIYAGGLFGGIGGANRNYLAALDARTGLATRFDAHLVGISGDEYQASPRAYSLDLLGNTLFVAGIFDSAGGRVRPNIAALDAASGALLGFDANATRAGGSYVQSVAASEKAIYVGGYFNSMGGQTRLCVAALDPRTGIATDWNPRSLQTVWAVCSSGRRVYLGGDIWSIGNDWEARDNLAALDATTGALKPWNAHATGYDVTCLALSGNTLYAGGDIFSMGGEPRSGLAAIDATTGAVTAWDPRSNGPVHSIVSFQGSVYVGGVFSRVGGQPRYFIAALDSATGLATPWNPSSNDIVNTLALKDGTLYAGGWFTSIGGQPRAGLAALSPGSAAATEWNPSGNHVVWSLAPGDSAIFAGWSSVSSSGASQEEVAAIHRAPDAATLWTADVDKQVEAIAIGGGAVYAGGQFSRIAGRSRASLAALDSKTGELSDWRADAGGYVWGLSTWGSTLYAGGFFQWIGAVPVNGLAGIEPRMAPRPGPDRPGRLALSDVHLSELMPNPVRATAILRFSLPVAAPVSLAVYDLQGRRIASLLDHEPQAPGEHSIAIHAAAWSPGFYFCRFEALGTLATRKMLVLR